jgi:DNA-binding NarL/FixJ family response regulator
MTFEQRVALMKPLSATEIEVLQNFADGVRTADIAASRNTTAQVIKNYTYRACQKLGADSRTQSCWRLLSYSRSRLAASYTESNASHRCQPVQTLW